MAPAQWPEQVDTIVVGNGPSALILSFILHGNIPYYNSVHPHPDPILHQRLQQAPCLLDVDISELTSHFAASRISYSTQALPINVLLDTLLRPLADTDPGEHKSCVEWRYEPLRKVEHLVLGDTTNAGGQWADNPVAGSWDIGALSYTEMLSLPGYSLPDHLNSDVGMVVDEFDRPSRRSVAEYLKVYPAKVGIDDSVYTNTLVRGISRSAEGFYIKSHDIRCKHLVLASGTFSNLVPARPMLQPLLEMPNSLSLNEFPRLVVGSGFTAADVILSTPVNRKVIHIFKWTPDEHPSPLRACHPSAYPEYATVYKEMKRYAKQYLGSPQSPTNSESDPFTRCGPDCRYEGLPNTYIKDVDVHGESATVTLENSHGRIFTREISHMDYVIGRRGSLEYLNSDLFSELLDDCECAQSSGIEGRTLRGKAQDNLEVAPNVFVTGSLTGDSLIRFAFGGCIYAAREIMRRNSSKAMDWETTSMTALDDKAEDRGDAETESATVCATPGEDMGIIGDDYKATNGHSEPGKLSDPPSPNPRLRRVRSASQRSRQWLNGCVVS